MKKKKSNTTISNNDVSYWESYDNISYWSSAFLKGLGYKSKHVTTNLNYFLKNIIHPDDRKIFRDHFFGLMEHNTEFKQKLLLKNKTGKYKEFNCEGNIESSLSSKPNSKIIFFTKKKHKNVKIFKNKHLFYRETAEMTSTGSWFVDFVKQKSYWDSETLKILEYPEDYEPSLKHGYRYYAQDCIDKATSLFVKCATQGKPFNTEIKMLTANKEEIWVKAIGKPVYNKKQDIVGIRGVFQNINDIKQKQIELEKTSNIITSQNSKLYNFAHIVSHNLRSHTSNLQLITQLIDTSETVEEKIELINSVKTVSDSLAQTIDHLNEIVTVQTQIDQTKEVIKFSDVLKLTKDAISQSIQTTSAKIISDFKAAESIYYINAYMQSIMLNLVTNSIKYKHTLHQPVIKLKTYINNQKKTVLEVSDNGIGIDLKQFGNKIFGMYRTFHQNSDAVGVGLFLVKNQVEALGGKISVTSAVNEGTTFKIIF